jgi:hypothetical protein
MLRACRKFVWRDLAKQRRTARGLEGLFSEGLGAFPPVVTGLGLQYGLHVREVEIQVVDIAGTESGGENVCERIRYDCSQF